LEPLISCSIAQAYSREVSFQANGAMDVTHTSSSTPAAQTENEDLFSFLNDIAADVPQSGQQEL